MIKKTFAFLLIPPTMLIALRCNSDRASTTQVSKDSTEVISKNDSINKTQLADLQRERRLNMQVFYRRSGGMGNTDFSNLKNGDTIHYVRGGTQRVYKVTHDIRYNDSLQSVRILIYSKGNLRKESTVSFSTQENRGHRIINFYDYGKPESTEQMVIISLDFFDGISKTVKPFTIYMLLDKEMDWV